MSLTGRKITVGLTGGIACYKIPYLIRLLIREGCEVRVVMTEAATKFITPLTLETVSRNPVATDLFPEQEFVATRHIDMAGWPDLVLIAPATANFIGKVASGISDDLLTTVVCASPRPIMIAPAMNTQMWVNPITQQNAKRLRGLGYIFVGPEEGEMAEPGHVGAGRMSEPTQILAAIKSFFKKSKKKALTGKKIIVTAGPTREAIDPVRYVSNRSSGKMGYAIAEAGVAFGADVVLISGPTALEPPAGVRFVAVESTVDLGKAVKKEFRKADCLIMAAAPSDFAPPKKINHKIKRTSAGLNLVLEPTTDILRSVSKLKSDHQVVVGFALETDNGLANARTKLREKNLDMIVLNSPGHATGFDSDTNQVTIIRPRRKPLEWPLLSKQETASKLIGVLASLLSND